MEYYSFFYLLPDWFCRIAIGRIECVVVAVGTAAGSFGPVPVRTGKAGIQGNFLHPSAEQLFDVFGVGVNAPLVVPGELMICRHLAENLAGQRYRFTILSFNMAYGVHFFNT
jgi:hypothetical protein